MHLVPLSSRLAIVATLILSALSTSARGQNPAAFFAKHCIRCHGPETAKSDITLHDLGRAPSAGEDLERWELVLEMLRSGEMPPEDETQPSTEERQRLVRWIDEGLRRALASTADNAPPISARRLTNFEFHNTMRDLLGVELDVAKDLPEDPSRPYAFRNSPRYMLMGLEQIDRYQEAVRLALKAAIVDPAPPKIYRTRRAWGAAAGRGMPDPSAMQPDELGIFGNRNRTVANGMRIDKWPEHSSFRIRLKASAILPPGVESVPLQVRMGYDIRGVGVGGNNPSAAVGTLRLTNTVDNAKVYELTGRIENYALQPERRYRRGGKRTGRLVIIPPHYTITPVNIYDDGTLNDNPDPLTRPRAVVEWIEFEAPIADVWPPAHHTRILFDSPLRASDPEAYVAEVLRRFLPRAFRRPVSEEDVARYTKVYSIVSEKLGLDSVEDAMRETLAMVLISPDFLYHTVEANGAGKHTDYEIASRLSYFLWGSMPDDALFEQAAAGRLRDPLVARQQVERMLADARAADFVENFASQWLALDKMRTVPIDLERFPRFLYTIKRGERRGREVPNRPTIRDWMHEESVAFVHELIRRNASLLRIVDSDFAMLNQPLAAHYGVEGVQGLQLRPVPLADDSPLGGVLTQAAILVGTSTGAAPHPVYRAVWLREAILGDHVPDPPADVPALTDSAGEEAVKKSATLKDLLRLHRKKVSCNDCHARLDPWGIPFEGYDATGRFRPRVPPAGTRVSPFDKKKHRDLAEYEKYLSSISTVDVETDAVVPGGAALDGMQDLKRYLLEKRAPDIARNVVRRLLTYALGRELTVRDHYVVEDLVQSSAKRGHGLRDLIVAVCRTDLFLGSSGARRNGSSGARRNATSQNERKSK